MCPWWLDIPLSLHLINIYSVLPVELHCPPLNRLCVITCKHSSILRWKTLPAKVPSKPAVCEFECVNKCVSSHKNCWAGLFNAIRHWSQLIYLFDDSRRWRESDGALQGTATIIYLGEWVWIMVNVRVEVGGGWIIRVGVAWGEEMEKRVVSWGS